VREKKASKQVYKSLGLLMINSFVVRVAIREQKQQQNAHKLAHRKDLIINVYGILKSTEKNVGQSFYEVSSDLQCAENCIKNIALHRKNHRDKNSSYQK
jgi:hypothetical protein